VSTSPAARDPVPAGVPVDRGRIRGETAAVVERLAVLVRALPPSVGGTRLIALDGPSGSGKSTIARGLAEALDAPVIHLDEVYDGWNGLAGIGDQLRRWVVGPLLAGRAPRWRRYDWAADRYAGWQTSPVAADLVLDGCGAGTGGVARHLALLVWVDAPAEVREERVRSRGDWAWYAPHRAGWARAESLLHERERTYERSDALVHNGERTVLEPGAGPRAEAVRAFGAGALGAGVLGTEALGTGDLDPGPHGHRVSRADDGEEGHGRDGHLAL